MKILDACCGSRMFWYERNEPHTTYMDIRREVLCYKDRQFIKWKKQPLLPGNNGYLNVQSNNIFLGDLEERDDTQTIFDELEIKKMRHDGRFRGIDFDHCLEEVKYDA